MAYRHPIGDDHPFRAVHALAQAEGLHELEIVDVHDGALIRLYHRGNQQVFRREGDPGSAIDRQRFDYWDHHSVAPDTPDNTLDAIKGIIAGKDQT